MSTRLRCRLFGHHWTTFTGHRMPFAPLTSWVYCARCGVER